MKIIDRFLVIVSFLAIHVSLNAQTARQVLDKTAGVITSKAGATARFSISGSKIKSEGSISLKGNKFYASTPQAAIWFNGKTQWSYMKSSNEVNISTPNEAKQAQMNPYKFLTLYRNGYQLSIQRTKKSYLVHLMAQDKKQGIQELYITINRTSYKPSLVKFRQGASWTSIIVSQVSTKKLADSIFEFPSKDYPKAEIIDLR